ncbi:MAG: type II toxin-antitoxin system HicA family toxin [Clostridiales bacterium]|nr:type II toxin-antitoxin system HicA family toxin [Clostridiales bacterium]
MPPVLRPEQIIKGLEGNGFRFVKQRGSHRKYKKNGRTVIVPMHDEVAKGTLLSILEQSGLTLAELLKYS